MRRGPGRPPKPAGLAQSHVLGGMRSRVPKTSELISLEIVRSIAANRMQAGDRLPIEAEMLAQYNVSRASLREALRLLEVQGLITIRSGPGSTTLVGRAHPINLARTMLLYLHLQGVTYSELLDAWLIFEPAMAELAAVNPDRERVRALMERHIAGGLDAASEDERLASGIDFHASIAALSGNRVLNLANNALGAMVSGYILAALKPMKLDSYEAEEEHRHLAEAIIAGDRHRARQLMFDHVSNLIEHFAGIWPKLVGEPLPLP